MWHHHAEEIDTELAAAAVTTTPATTPATTCGTFTPTNNKIETVFPVLDANKDCSLTEKEYTDGAKKFNVLESNAKKEFA